MVNTSGRHETLMRQQFNADLDLLWRFLSREWVLLLRGLLDFLLLLEWDLRRDLLFERLPKMKRCHILKHSKSIILCMSFGLNLSGDRVRRAGVFTGVLSEIWTAFALTANGNVCACHLFYLQNNDTKLNISKEQIPKS